jgi:hypothetical protein
MLTPRNRQLRYALAVAVTAVCVVTAGGGEGSLQRLTLIGDGVSVATSPATSGVEPSTPDVVGATSPSDFAITGSVSGLYPGRTLPLVLTVYNPRARTITVTSLSTTVGNASSHCVKSNLDVTTFSGQLPVPPRGTAAVTVKVTMAHSAPNSCQASIFPLHYLGTAMIP